MYLRGSYVCITQSSAVSSSGEAAGVANGEHGDLVQGSEIDDSLRSVASDSPVGAYVVLQHLLCSLHEPQHQLLLTSFPIALNLCSDLLDQLGQAVGRYEEIHRSGPRRAKVFQLFQQKFRCIYMRYHGTNHSNENKQDNS